MTMTLSKTGGYHAVQRYDIDGNALAVEADLSLRWPRMEVWSLHVTSRWEYPKSTRRNWRTVLKAIWLREKYKIDLRQRASADLVAQGWEHIVYYRGQDLWQRAEEVHARA